MMPRKEYGIQKNIWQKVRLVIYCCMSVADGPSFFVLWLQMKLGMQAEPAMRRMTHENSFHIDAMSLA